MLNNLRPVIMGILNITPDSFSDGSDKYTNTEFQLAKALKMIENGADIIDIGGESTRPGADYISTELEIARILPVIEKLRNESAIKISIDTNKAAVADAALTAGADIINDITGLTGDPAMIDVVAKHKAKVVIMHMQGTPKHMQKAPVYQDTLTEVLEFLNSQYKKAVSRGIEKEKIIIDPGFGFGKRQEDNYLLMRNIDKFVDTGLPVLIGVSRKSMIGKALDLAVSERMEASIALAVMSYLQGAHIFRVHDVCATRRALDMIYSVNNG